MGLVRLLRKTKADVVHSQVNFSLLQQLFAAQLAGMVYLVTERNCYERSGFALYRRRIQYYLLKAFGIQYSANSRRVAEHLARMLNERIEQFPVFPNGITVESRDVGLPPKANPNSPVTIAYIARMARHKGHMFFLEVIEKLIHHHNRPVKAILIGDGPMRPDIENAVEEKKLSNYVQLTGVVHNVEDHIRDADIVALFSDYEGMPNVVIEAMALGRPVVASDSGNVRELLQSGAGLVLDIKDVNCAAELIESLVSNPSKRQQMGKIGQTIVERQYSLATVLGKLFDNYNNLLSK
jgi:glycosyltransferase involved in cell wall biosynthesis